MHSRRAPRLAAALAATSSGATSRSRRASRSASASSSASSSESKRLAKKARDGKLKPEEYQGGTFTITNIGSQGALFDTPILVPPQAAMLGTGAIVKRPVVITGEDHWSGFRPEHIRRIASASA